MTEDQFKTITTWQDETFPNSTALSKVEHLKQEVNELTDSIYVTDNYVEDDNLRLEFADCLFLIFGAAYKKGMSYQDICNAIDEKLEINKQREWGKPDENGVVNHIKK